MINFLTLSQLGPPDLARASCVCQAWCHDGHVALAQVRVCASIRVQAVMRRCLATTTAARMRSDKFLDMLHDRRPATARFEEGLGIPQPLWAAFSACAFQRLCHQWEVGETYQEYAADKLLSHDMAPSAECFRVRGRGLLAALSCARRLTIEQLACLGV